MKEKTPKKSKPRQENYVAKLAVDLTFTQMIKVMVGKADEVKKEKKADKPI